MLLRYALGVLHGQLLLLLESFLLQMNLLNLILLLIHIIELRVGISIHLVRVSVIIRVIQRRIILVVPVHRAVRL